MTRMLTPHEALAIILANVPPRRTGRAPLEVAHGRVAARDIIADIEMPRFDRAMMDGYAVRSEDCGHPPVDLAVIEELHAGSMARETVRSGTSIRIMTGAPVPDGADAVLQHELTESLDSRRRVRINAMVRPGLNISRRAEDLSLGDVVITAGTVLGPAEIGLAAMVGAAEIEVVSQPRVAVLSTGDELVPVDERPVGGQIRESNSWALWAQLADCGIPAERMGVAKDTRAELDARIAQGLATSDCLMLSGGVSAGDADLVVGALHDAGVATLFHKVALKPGAPLFFGRRGDSIVFGFPGNPVSTFVCFELFARPLLAAWSGNPRLARPVVEATLTRAVSKPIPRDQYLPALATLDPEKGWRIKPVEWHGSGDLRGLARANSLAVIPAGESRETGSRVSCVLLAPIVPASAVRPAPPQVHASGAGREL